MNRLVFDFETGAQPIETLREYYEEPTFEEFAESCDKRWKPETVQQKYEEKKPKMWEKFVEDAALNAHTAEILAIGFMDVVDQKPAIIKQTEKKNEADIITMFWKKYTECVNQKREMVGLNIFGYDLPMIIRRSIILGLDFPANIRQQRRYWNPIFLDMKDDWLLGQNSGSKWSADFLAKTLGVGGKTNAKIDGIEICGKNFGRLFRGTPEQHNAALEYLANDLLIECKIAKRLGL